MLASIRISVVKVDGGTLAMSLPAASNRRLYFWLLLVKVDLSSSVTLPLGLYALLE